MKLSHQAKWTIMAVSVLSLTGATIYGFSRLNPKETPTPTTRVQKGAVELDVVADGELRCPHTMMVVAPPVSGTLQIVKLAKTGSTVKEGEVIVEFDPSEQEYNLEQAQSQLHEAQQEIVKARAEAAVQTAKDKVDLLKARFDVRRAELEVQKNELLSDIDAKKNVLALDEARRRLTQIQQDVTSRQASSDAGLAVLQQKSQQATLNMQQAQHNIDSMIIKAPMDGVVAIKDNQDASGGFFYTGMILPEYHEGDQVWPGRFIAEVLDMKQLELVAKINELDRSNVNPGSPVEIHVFTDQKRQYSGKVRNVATLASKRMWGADAVRTFDATFEISSAGVQLRPGATAQVVIHGKSMKDQLFLPSQCIFERDGNPTVYMREGNGFRPQSVKVVSRTEARAVVEGLSEGTEVALLDPSVKDSVSAASKAGSVSGAAR